LALALGSFYEKATTEKEEPSVLVCEEGEERRRRSLPHSLANDYRVDLMESSQKMKRPRTSFFRSPTHITKVTSTAVSSSYFTTPYTSLSIHIQQQQDEKA
jgi:hypothetical protein